MEVEFPSSRCWSQRFPTDRNFPSGLLLGMYAPSAASQRGGVCHDDDHLDCHSEEAHGHWPDISGQARKCADGQTKAAKGCEV